MKIDKKSWIPIIGIIFAINDGGWLFLYEDWLKYQSMCILCLFLYLITLVF